jgi:transcriptional regulator with XRE-family HTH domain
VAAENPNVFVARTIRQIVAIRKSKGITVEELAERLGTADQNVRRLEAGQNITLRMLRRVSVALGLKVEITFSDDPSGPTKPAPGRRRTPAD